MNTKPTAAPMLDYVLQTAAVLRLPLSDSRALRVAETLARTAVMVESLEGVEIGAADELSEVFRPAPFPSRVFTHDRDRT